MFSPRQERQPMVMTQVRVKNLERQSPMQITDRPNATKHGDWILILAENRVRMIEIADAILEIASPHVCVVSIDSARSQGLNFLESERGSAGPFVVGSEMKNSQLEISP